MAVRNFTIAYTHRAPRNGDCSWHVESPIDGGLDDRQDLLRFDRGNSTGEGDGMLCPPKYGVEHGRRTGTTLDVVRSRTRFMGAHTLATSIERRHPELAQVAPCLGAALRIADHFEAGRQESTAERLAMAGLTHDAMLSEYANQATQAEAAPVAQTTLS